MKLGFHKMQGILLLLTEDVPVSHVNKSVCLMELEYKIRAIRNTVWNNIYIFFFKLRRIRTTIILETGNVSVIQIPYRHEVWELWYVEVCSNTADHSWPEPRINPHRTSHFFSYSIRRPIGPHFFTLIRAFSFLQYSVINLIPIGVIPLLPECNGMSSDHSNISNATTCKSYHNITDYVLTTFTILVKETNDNANQKT